MASACFDSTSVSSVRPDARTDWMSASTRSRGDCAPSVSSASDGVS